METNYTSNFNTLNPEDFYNYYEKIVVNWLTDFEKFLCKNYDLDTKKCLDLTKKIVYKYFTICKNIQKRYLYLYSIVSYIIALKYIEDFSDGLPLFKLAYAYSLKVYDLEIMKDTEFMILDILSWNINL